MKAAVLTVLIVVVHGAGSPRAACSAKRCAPPPSASRQLALAVALVLAMVPVLLP